MSTAFLEERTVTLDLLRLGILGHIGNKGARRTSGQRRIRQRGARLPSCLEQLEARTLLAYTATIDAVAHTVTFTGNEAGDILIFDADTRGHLRHNRFTAHDPGFASNIDLDSSLPGVQSAVGAGGVFVNAGAGDDTINIGTPAVPASVFEQVFFVLDGEDGSDTLNLDDTANKLGSEGVTETLTSTQFENFLFYSNIENLTLNGGSGVDQIDVQSTADGTLTRLNGGAGDDSATVHSTGIAGLILDGQTGTDTATIIFGSLAGPVTVVDYGGTFSGSDGNDTLVLTDTQLTSGAETIDLSNTAVIPTLTGGEGDDTIDASSATRAAVLDGGNGNDSISGGSQGDTILGGNGDDVLSGGSGDDTFVFTNGFGIDSVDADGTTDQDKMDFSAVTDNLTITLGSVTVQDAAGSFAQHIGNQIEKVISGTGNDSVICTAATGKLIMQLLAGNDQVDCSLSPVGLNIDGGSGNDTLVGSSENDILIGGGDQDSLVGNGGDDTLVGGPGDDVLEDSSGNNSLVGGIGCDTTNGTADPPSCALPYVEFSAASFSVRESGRNATIRVTLGQAVAGVAGVSYSITGGTATAGTDFTARTGTVMFAAGQTSRTFTVAIRGDKLDEVDETINLALTGSTGLIGLGELTTATLAIQDDDATPTLRFAKTALRVKESKGVASFTVSLSAASGRPISVNFATLNGTAQDGPDYTGVGNPLPTINFAPGQRTQIIQIPIVNDSDVEPKETFSVQLSNVVNAILPTATPTATMTILSDDVAPRAAIRSSVIERPIRRTPRSSAILAIDEILAEHLFRRG